MSIQIYTSLSIGAGRTKRQYNALPGHIASIQMSTDSCDANIDSKVSDYHLRVQIYDMYDIRPALKNRSGEGGTSPPGAATSIIGLPIFRVFRLTIIVHDIHSMKSRCNRRYCLMCWPFSSWISIVTVCPRRMPFACVAPGKPNERACLRLCTMVR